MCVSRRAAGRGAASHPGLGDLTRFSGEFAAVVDIYGDLEGLSENRMCLSGSFVYSAW